MVDGSVRTIPFNITDAMFERLTDRRDGLVAELP